MRIKIRPPVPMAGRVWVHQRQRSSIGLCVGARPDLLRLILSDYFSLFSPSPSQPARLLSVDDLRRTQNLAGGVGEGFAIVWVPSPNTFVRDTSKVQGPDPTPRRI